MKRWSVPAARRSSLSQTAQRGCCGGGCRERRTAAAAAAAAVAAAAMAAAAVAVATVATATVACKGREHPCGPLMPGPPGPQA